MKVNALFKTVGLACFLAVAAGCATDQTTASGSQDKYEKTMAEAQAALKLAKSKNNVWRDNEKFLKQAEEEAKKGDYDKATKLAEKAKFQSEMAVKQIEAQPNPGPYK
ncbi:MAG: hypothetical protein PHI49_03445 [Halothiobacillaceae bacterium]|jgi:predicted S18 family serine protease|nr:hypothetical protein [Halothiobacillaceae bacterium]MDY0050543.1 hypothetical protein [Halothiobacillaceae bacterium]